MLTAETLHPACLASKDETAWRALCAEGGPFESPLLGPDFAKAVSEVRGDARITIWRREGAAVGFLAHHLRPGGLIRPIGAPLSDYHALVSAPEAGLGLEEALAVAGLSAFRFTGLIDPERRFQSAAASEQEGYVIRLDEGPEAYLEALRAASPKRFKNFRRLDHKLDREVGELRIVGPDTSREGFDALLAWKRDQLRRTGVHDFLRPDWVRGLFSNLFARREGELEGMMINLYAGDRLVAGHFGIRLGNLFHPWIASTDPDMAVWSPGQVFIPRAISAMPEMGLSVYDLGPGYEHYKAPFSRSRRLIYEGLAAEAGPAGAAARASARLWALAGANGSGPIGKIRRRLDAIACVELSLAGRARGVADALTARAFRRAEAAG